VSTVIYTLSLHDALPICANRFVSVPNHRLRVFGSNTMWRTERPPLGIAVAGRNLPLAGSNPCSRFGCGPVSTNHTRPRSSVVIAYGPERSEGVFHSLNTPSPGL